MPFDPEILIERLIEDEIHARRMALVKAQGRLMDGAISKEELQDYVEDVDNGVNALKFFRKQKSV